MNIKESRGRGAIKLWESSCENIATVFTKKYFGSAETWWVGDEVGGCAYVNEYFFTIDDMVNFLRHSYSTEKMFEYYDKRLDSCQGGPDFHFNIKNYKCLKEVKVKKIK